MPKRTQASLDAARKRRDARDNAAIDVYVERIVAEAPAPTPELIERLRPYFVSQW